VGKINHSNGYIESVGSYNNNSNTHLGIVITILNINFIRVLDKKQIKNKELN